MSVFLSPFPFFLFPLLRDVEARQQTGYSIAIDYFDLILDRDPRFIRAYYYLSNTASIYLGKPEQSLERMARGLKSFSVSVPDKGYYVWRLKAIDRAILEIKSLRGKDSD